MTPPPRSRRSARFHALHAGCGLCALALLAGAAAAQEVPAEDDPLQRLLDELADLRAEVTDLRGELDDSKRGAAQPGGAPAEPGGALPLFDDPDDDDTFFIPRNAAQFAQSGEPSTFGNIYTRPFLADMDSDVSIGGYIDLEFSDPAGDASKEFDQHRFVPFIYADVSERVKIAAEVELEHGHEVEVEFAQIDYLFSSAFNLRAGILLLPVGKLNEVHDSPIQDLTARPLVNRYIIPTTLRDAGIGAYGSLGQTLDYQVAITNGFRGLDAAGVSAISSKDGLRKAAPQSDTLNDPFSNTNDDLAYSGRLAWSPILGAEVGVSALVDHYDEKADNRLALYALDAQIDGKAVDFLPDPLELLGEAAWADLDRDAFAKAAGVPNDMNGYYAQANWHFGGAALEECESDLYEQGAHFTFVTRYDSIELGDYAMRRTTLGLNFRPNPSHTVFKLDFQFNKDAGSLKGSNDDNAILASAATYF